MSANVFSPDELETLLEDAILLGDGRAAAQLFEPGGLLVAGPGSGEARGRGAIAAHVRAASGQPGYVADPCLVARSRDIALLAGPTAVNVARCRPRGGWRLVISLHRWPAR
jgi:uncharacterized protein (TIGR02246 family)